MNNRSDKKAKLNSSSRNTERIHLYGDKRKEYFSETRDDIAALVPSKANKVLDIGCGAGVLLTKLKETGKASEIVGIDINKLEGSCGLDQFLIGDIEQIALPYPPDYFDVIICADVLEHLRDPWETLRKIVFYLNTNGLFIASIPNFREIRTLHRIMVKGNLEYADAGILDKTHLRFFCKKNIIDLVNQAGLRVSSVYPCMGGKRPLVNKMSFGLFEELLAVQYIITAKK